MKIFSGGEKMRNASGLQGENEWRDVSGRFSLKSCKKTPKKCTKKCAARAKLFFAN